MLSFNLFLLTLFSWKLYFEQFTTSDYHCWFKTNTHKSSLVLWVPRLVVVTVDSVVIELYCSSLATKTLPSVGAEDLEGRRRVGQAKLYRAVPDNQTGHCWGVQDVSSLQVVSLLYLSKRGPLLSPLRSQKGSYRPKSGPWRWKVEIERKERLIAEGGLQWKRCPRSEPASNLLNKCCR